MPAIIIYVSREVDKHIRNKSAETGCSMSKLLSRSFVEKYGDVKNVPEKENC